MASWLLNAINAVGGLLCKVCLRVALIDVLCLREIYMYRYEACMIAEHYRIDTYLYCTYHTIYQSKNPP